VTNDWEQRCLKQTKLFCLRVFVCRFVFQQDNSKSCRWISWFWGLTENDGHENDRPSKLQDMKLQDTKKTDRIAKKCRTWNCGTKWQSMKLQDMNLRDMKLEDKQRKSSNRDYIIMEFLLLFSKHATMVHSAWMTIYLILDRWNMCSVQFRQD